MGSTAVLIAVRRAERRILDRLRAQGATSADRAQELPELRMIEGRRLERLKDAGAVVEPSPGRYYVNEAAYAELRGERRYLVWTVLAVAIGLALWLAMRASP